MKTKTLFRISLILLFALAISSCDELKDENEDIQFAEATVTEDITESVTWETGNIYIIDGTVRVGASQTVVITIEPGAIIKFNEDATLDMAYWDNEYATIIAKGTASNPIIFTSNCPSPEAGDWKSINFYQGAINCEFENCTFEYGGSNDYYGIVSIEETSVSFTSCSFKNSSTLGIYLKNNGEFSNFNGNYFTGISTYPISIYPAAVHTLEANNSYESGKTIFIDGDQDLNISGEYVWKNQGIPFTFDGVMRMGTENTQGLQITIEPGVTLKMTTDSYIDLAYWDNTYATIIAVGTEELPITFTSNSPSPEAGDWRSINFYKGAINCEFDFCEFEYGGGNDYYGNIYIEETAVSFTNCKFSNSDSYAIKLTTEGEFFDFFKNTFSSHALYPISIYPNAVYSMGPENNFETGSSIYVDAGQDLTMNGEFTWLHQSAPYTMDGTMRLGSVNGTKLNINAGTVLKFTNGSVIDVAYWDANSGQIVANGSVDEPVVFTSNSPSPAKGDWKGLYFYNGVNGTNLNNCKVEYAGSSDYMGAVALSESGNGTILFTNSEISNSNSYGITVDDESSLDYSTITFINNENSDYHER
ncbi:MAG: hypothetical protein JEZ09_15325 [Salinivirgaceae bacterium]|nr:hypothetical protein [Salinivirgaceae bacterium]